MSETKTNISEISQTEIDKAKMANVNTRPNSPGLYGEKTFTATDLKAKMDELALLGVEKVNALINAIHNGEMASDLQVPAVFGGDEELTNLYAFLTNLKTALSNGYFASLIMTNGGENAQNVQSFLNSLQTQIGYATSPEEGSLRKQITDNKEDIEGKLKETSEELQAQIDTNRADITKNKEDIGNRVDGIVNEVSSDIGEAIEELANFVYYLTGEEIEFPETPIEQPLRKSINNLEERVTTLEKCMDELFEEITDDEITHIKTIPDDKKILPIGFVTRLGGLSRTTDNVLAYPFNEGTCGYTFGKIFDANTNSSTDGELNKLIRGGVTFTDNGDGTITLCGKTTECAGTWKGENAGNCLAFSFDLALPAGKYVLGCECEIVEESAINPYLYLWRNNTSSQAVPITEGISYSKPFTLKEKTTFDEVRIMTGTQIGVKIGELKVAPFIMPVDNDGKNEIEYKYTPYYEGYKHAKVTSIISKDASGNVISKFAIPSEIQNLEGYGLGISKDVCNYIDFEAKTYTQMVKLDDNDDNEVIKELAEASVTDISAHLPTLHCTINLAAGGTVTFESVDESGNDIGARCVSELSYLEVNK